MEVRLLIHMEVGESGLVWWTESPDVPGFSGTGDHLVEARVRSEVAIRDILAEQGVHDVSFTYELVEPGTQSEGPSVVRTGQVREGVDSGSQAAAAVATAA